MPRPGPRPYECVRKAWHSDRHQPMRGSIVQQIFRLVNETHSSATKKNKEWQEKLPVVVLRAEEIMYSKANSEAEYMNLDTIWDRVNDAINTIIRRDESTETGELLPPCVEAALNLGCIAVRAPRSQRLSNPRTYLSPRGQEPTSGHARTLGDPCPQLLPRQSNEMFNVPRNPTLATSPETNSNKLANQNANLLSPSTNPFSLENVPLGHNQFLTMEAKRSLKFGSVYPLYYGAEHQTKESMLQTNAPAVAFSNTIFVGTPIITPIPETAQPGLFPNLFSRGGTEHPATINSERTDVSSQEKPRDRYCDLSLRLGLYSHPRLGGGKSSVCNAEDVWSANSQGEIDDQLFPHMDTQLPLYMSRTTYNGSFGSGSTKWIPEVEDQNLEPSFRKRKAPF